ncbi:AlpA family transcriptional regulator [Parafrankia sp. BMG5.11]|uniref:helix-turn-helix transcriptional regulator n=1 Tax=Parafrankia sp. BMG5.11 TaxID=222540 RepID=UPI001039DF07|nr:helix-turn-helix domain-containing protein [Parafrankia sp. BMG5.11]TCJ37359.1 DNA-binding protein [Parafrankia sp. BMG5.11]
MKPHVLNTAGAAEHTGLAVPTLEKLRCSGGGPVYLKLGRAVRYRASDLDEWLARRTISSTSEESVR